MTDTRTQEPDTKRRVEVNLGGLRDVAGSDLGHPLDPGDD